MLVLIGRRPTLSHRPFTVIAVLAALGVGVLAPASASSAEKKGTQLQATSNIAKTDHDAKLAPTGRPGKVKLKTSKHKGEGSAGGSRQLTDFQLQENSAQHQKSTTMQSNVMKRQNETKKGMIRKMR